MLRAGAGQWFEGNTSLEGEARGKMLEDGVRVHSMRVPGVHNSQEVRNSSISRTIMMGLSNIMRLSDVAACNEIPPSTATLYSLSEFLLFQCRLCLGARVSVIR